MSSNTAEELRYAISTPRHWDVRYKAFPKINQDMLVSNTVPALHEAEQQAKQPDATDEAKYYYGIALYRDGQYKESVAVLRALIPDNPDRWGVYKWTGYALMGTGDLNGSAEMFAHIATIKDAPNEILAGALSEQGNCLWEMGRLDEAANAYRKTLDLDANSVVALMALTDIALRQKDTAQAKRYLDRLSQLPMTTKNQRILAQLQHRLETGT